MAEELQAFTNLTIGHPEAFALGNKSFNSAALNATKAVFDFSVGSENVSQTHIIKLLSALEPSCGPKTRSQKKAGGKRKRSPSPKATFMTTPLTTLFIDGMDDEQIWAQLDIRAKNICDTLEFVLEGGSNKDVDDMDNSSEEIVSDTSAEDIGFGADDMFIDNSDAFMDVSNSEETGSDLEVWNTGDHNEDVTGLHDPSSSEDSSEDDNLDFFPSGRNSQRRMVKTNNELDDGFFDLVSFNAESEGAEARSSTMGQLDGGEDSDTDPFIDLFAPLDHNKILDEDDLEGDSGEILYRDFFEPPRLAGSKLQTKPLKNLSTGRVRFHEEVRVKKIKAKGKNLPLTVLGDDDDTSLREERTSPASFTGLVGEHKDENDDDDSDLIDGEDMGESEDELRRITIDRLKDDLFAEEEGIYQDLSTHEKKLTELREQIEKLEAENVGPKDWVLMGEAGSRMRPQNSLLEEDLDFERALKAAPIITEEVVQGLEERIKARILEGRFDDVIRIRPIEDKPFLPSQFFELKDTKSTQSLAQVYESDFVAAQTGETIGEDRDGKLKKEHEEIEQLWESITRKLDALCNAHFIPKQPRATISTIPNVSTATIENALPTTKSTNTLLAPEEVHAPLRTELCARSELTPVAKRALRGRERREKKKSRATLEKNIDKYARIKGVGRVKRQKQAALESIVKNGKGVTVVGKSPSIKKGHRS